MIDLYLIHSSFCSLMFLVARAIKNPTKSGPAIQEIITNNSIIFFLATKQGAPPYAQTSIIPPLVISRLNICPNQSLLFRLMDENKRNRKNNLDPIRFLGFFSRKAQNRLEVFLLFAKVARVLPFFTTSLKRILIVALFS